MLETLYTELYRFGQHSSTAQIGQRSPQSGTPGKTGYPDPGRYRPQFLFALGCTVRSATFIVTACLMTQLNIISALTRTRKIRIGEFWRQLGLASDDKASVQHAAPHPCPLCHTPATVFFHIQLATGPESTVLLQNLLQARHEAIETVWSGQGIGAAQKCDTKTIERDGAHLCFGCAIKTIPDLMEKHACPQPAPPVTMPDHPPDRLSPDTQSTSNPLDATRPYTTSPTRGMGPRQRNRPQFFQDQASANIDASIKSPQDHRPVHDPDSAANSLKTRIQCEMEPLTQTDSCFHQLTISYPVLTCG